VVGWIDTVVPQATVVLYTPNIMTTGNVVAHLFLNEAVLPVGVGWVKVTDTYFTKVYLNNVSETVQFTDLAGNVGQTGIVITQIEKFGHFGARDTEQLFIAPQH
jgi:hypothetical protein